jgi:hypothetical protein
LVSLLLLFSFLLSLFRVLFSFLVFFTSLLLVSFQILFSFLLLFIFLLGCPGVRFSVSVFFVHRENSPYPPPLFIP